MRKLARCDLLILDDFALRALDATQTTDFYEVSDPTARNDPCATTFTDRQT